jgi:hypothetical protein
MGGCCGDGIPSCEAMFDDRAARDDLRQYRWWARVFVTLGNPLFFARRSGFRFRIHRRATVATLLREAGFVPLAERNGVIWRVETWERRPAT